MMTQASLFNEEFDYAFRCAAHLVAATYDLEPSAFTGQAKGSERVVHARQVFVYLLYTDGADFGSVVIAKSLGRHHSMVWHSIQRITALRDDPDLDAGLERLGEMYRDLLDARARIPALVGALSK